MCGLICSLSLAHSLAFTGSVCASFALSHLLTRLLSLALCVPHLLSPLLPRSLRCWPLGLTSSLSLQAVAALPASLGTQIQRDACSMGQMVGHLARGFRSHALIVKLEIIDRNNCSRWHQDQYAGDLNVCLYFSFVCFSHVCVWLFRVLSLHLSSTCLSHSLPSTSLAHPLRN